MKRLFNRLMYMSLLGILLFGTGQKSLAQDVTVSYQTFYDDLSPYGQWVSDPQYGNVWVPNEGGDFRPYGTRGHWVMTDYGNTWVSDDPWGWACYHYGRWTYDQYYGWIWIPGYEWAPAWVSWRYGGGYSGWAPLGPGISVGVNYNCPESWWIFVQPQYMYHDDCIHYWRGPSYNSTYIRRCAYVNNVYVDNGTHVRYNYGPRQDVIQRDTHQPVQVYHVSQMHRPGAPSVSGNRVSLYRPAVNRATANTARPSNIVQAPRAIGRPQAATNVSPSRQAPFRQQIQKQAPVNAGNRGQSQGNIQQPGGRQQRGQVQPGRQPINNPQPQRQQPQLQRQQPQPQRQQPQPQRQQPMPQRQQPQPQRQQPQPQRQQPMPQQQQPQFQRQQPQPQRQQPMPQRQQPQFQRQQPQPQRQQPMPQRQQPQPQQRQPMPQPQRQPMPQPQRQQPMPQRQQPMPQQHMEAPRQAPPHEEGGRR